VRRLQLLRDGADDLDVDGLGQPGKLLERVLGGPRLSVGLDGDEQRALGFANLECGVFVK
jgi:hypothetical protein